IDTTRDQRRHLAGGHGNHCLVKQSYSTTYFSTANQRPALSLQSQSRQITVVEPPADLSDSLEGSNRRRPIAAIYPAIPGWQQEISFFHAVRLISQQALSACQPAIGLRTFSIEHRGEAQPKCAPRRIA